MQPTERKRPHTMNIQNDISRKLATATIESETDNVRHKICGVHLVTQDQEGQPSVVECKVYCFLNYSAEDSRSVEELSDIVSIVVSETFTLQPSEIEISIEE